MVSPSPSKNPAITGDGDAAVEPPPPAEDVIEDPAEEIEEDDAVDDPDEDLVEEEEEEVEEEEEEIEEEEVAIEEEEVEMEEQEGDEVENEGKGDGGDGEAKGAEEPPRKKTRQRDFEVFIGGLPRDATKDDIKDVFGKVGQVVEVRLVKNKTTKKNKGFAFLRYASVDQAKRAATELKNVKVKGKSCGVFRNNDNDTLHVGNICNSWTKDDLMEKLKAFELKNLEEVHLIDDPNRKGKNRGYAFLDFKTHVDAAAACNKLQKKDVFFGIDTRAEISFSKTAPEPDEEVMAHVKSVFLDGLPASWDENQVRKHFKKFGEIENVQLARNMPLAKRKDFGSVSFSTREAALDCIEKVNKDGVGEGSKKISMKATLKRPLPKRVPPTMGVRGRPIGGNIGRRMLQPYGSGRSFPERPRPRESMRSKGFGDRERSLGKFSTRGGGARTASPPPTGRFGARPRREFVRNTSSSTGGRPRDPFIQRSSRGRRAAPDYLDSSSSYAQRRGPYEDDMYDSRFEYLEPYDYPAVSGYKRSYSEMEHDEVLASSSVASRGRPRSMNTYPRSDSSVYEEYSRYLAEEPLGDGRMEFAGRGYGSRYLPGSAPYRSYY